MKTTKSISTLILFVLSFFYTSYTLALNDVKHIKRSDSLITAETKLKLLKNPILPLDVSVETNDGLVTLSGLLDTKIQRKEIQSTVESVAGVRGIDVQNLKISSNKQLVADGLITTRAKIVLIKEKLLGNDELSLMPLHVETKNGVVYLMGWMPNKRVLKTVLSKIEAVNGVSHIEHSVKFTA